jgi:hypothetical protein
MIEAILILISFLIGRYVRPFAKPLRSHPLDGWAEMDNEKRSDAELEM